MATITEKSRTKEIIDRLQHILNNASPVPLAAGKVTVYKDEVQTLLDELAMQMENELKTYHEVNDRRGKIINEAKKEAEKIIYQAEHSASRMRVSKRSTKVAPLDYNTLNEEEIASLGNANEIYAASLIYTDEMLTEVSKVIEEAYHNIRSDYEIVMQVLEEKMNTIISNKDELMMGLQEMDIEERSQQILEIGQLLSNELYNERMKQRGENDGYEVGSGEPAIDLKVEKAEENARAAEAMAKQTAEALEQMTAERNALMETVMKMEREQLLAKQAAERQSAMANAAAPRSMGEHAKADVPTAGKNTAVTENDNIEYEIEYVTEDELEEGEEYEIEYVDDDEDVEYEIEYVTEDELEEGEEYEIEYVDDDEDVPQQETAVKTEIKEGLKNQKGNQKNDAKQVDAKEVKEAKGELNRFSKEEEMPVISHLKKSEKVASAPSEQIAKMAKAVTTDKKYSGLIGRAVANREKAQAAVTVEDDNIMGVSSSASVEKNEKKPEITKVTENAKKTENNGKEEREKNAETSGKKETGEKKNDDGKEVSGKKNGSGNTAVNSRRQQQKENRKEEKKPAVDKGKQDEDIKTDANGNQYVQATMQFDDDFEIMEF